MVKRSFIYLTRKFKRSILLTVLLIFVSFSLSIGLCIWNSINIVTKEVRQTLGTSFNFSLPSFITGNEAYYVDVENDEGVVTKAYMGPELNDELIAKIMQIDGVAGYNAENDQWVHLDNLQLCDGLYASIEIDPNDPDEMIVILGMGKTIVRGNTDTSLYHRFRAGTFVLTQGRHLTPNDEKKVLISEELAKLNNINIGDKITLSMRLGIMGGADCDAMELCGMPLELEIVGIFRVNGYQPTDWVSEAEIAYNWILTDTNVVKYFELIQYQTLSNDFIQEPRYKNVTFFVQDSEDVETVLQNVKGSDSFDTSVYSISVDDTMYRATVEPLNSIRNLVVGLVMVIILGCVSVLCIVFTMWVRSRKQEIAIYLSLGFSKVSIIGQFILEAAIVVVAASVLSFALCQRIPDVIGNQLLTSTIERSQPQEREYTYEEIHQAAQSGTMSNLFHYEASDYAGPDHIDFTFRFTDFFIVLAIELLIIVGAICKGASFIFKMQPRQIMTELR